MTRPIAGFRYSGVAAGIKTDGSLDLGLIAADEPVAAAGVFTQNLVRAAPVLVSERRLKAGRSQAILVNSGNANACTGKDGHRNAIGLTRALSKSLGVPSGMVLPASTGVIGVQLPAPTIEAAIPALVDGLSDDGASTFARSIMTTDRGPKLAEASVTLSGKRCRLLGIAKGAGMIHPDMATTLAFVTTDADVSPKVLRSLLVRASERTFNRASVDGDTSTNDSIYALASGAAGNRGLPARGTMADKFEQALVDVLEPLAKMIVADGEGAEHLVRIEVRGARTDQDAVQVARTVAGSQLVKTAIHGADPNWGRILAAAGRAGVRFNPDHTTIRIGSVRIFAEGRPTMPLSTEKRAIRVMQRTEYEIRIDLGRGRGLGHYWTCDLGHEYVRINADYRT
ncbi:MAG: bifunctional glutamate N-acetyltransferase/amino-acid acetyltransferase ArgJ [Myxococcota bacterium]